MSPASETHALPLCLKAYFHSSPKELSCLLQNEKGQLETAMVVESRIQMKQKGLSKRSMGESEDTYVASEVSHPGHRCLCAQQSCLHPIAGQAQAGAVMICLGRQVALSA